VDQSNSTFSFISIKKHVRFRPDTTRLVIKYSVLHAII
jgi:hypothetical protein